MHGGDQIPLVGLDTAMTDAILEMTAKSFGCVGIVGGSGQLAGIITDGDLRRHMDSDLLSLSAGAVMTPGPKAIRPQALAAEALGLMNDLTITSLFVVEDGRPVGLVHMHDCLRAGIT
jgi:arabinose-5-phosphate isomerase